MIHRLLAWSRRWFDPLTVEQVLEPMFADWQHELRSAASRRARALSAIRGAAAFVTVVFRLSPTVIFAPMPLSFASSALARVVMFCIPIAALQVAVLMGGWSVPLLSWAYLLPGTLVVAIPFSVILVVDLIRDDSTLDAHAQRRLLTQTVALAAVAMVVGLAVVVPEANQKWRELAVASMHGVSTTAVPKGWREQTVIDLWQASTDARPEIGTRVLLMALPVLLAWLRWTAYPLLSARLATRAGAEVAFALTSLVLWTLIRFLGFSAGWLYGGFPEPGNLTLATLFCVSLEMSFLFEVRRRRFAR